VATRAGLRAFDADTHVNPATEVLERYVDPSFRPRLADLAPDRTLSGHMMGGTPDTHQYRVATVGGPPPVLQARRCKHGPWS
jgi:hypothetical protein